MNIFNHKPVFFSTILCLSLSATTQARVKMNIDATQRSAMISDYQYGLFLEEINHAGDGGLYAELIRNLLSRITLLHPNIGRPSGRVDRR